MSPDDFLCAYAAALEAQDWQQVEPLVHADACVTFSTGAVHRGKEAVRQAFERNFASIQGDTYRMLNLHWIRRDEPIAVYTFDFTWSGRIDERPASGSGRGTGVLVRESGAWMLLAEHLSAASVNSASE